MTIFMDALGMLITKVYDTADYLEDKGIDISEVIKRRDRREPGRRRKEETEELIYNTIRKIWRNQTQRLKEYLEETYAERKNLSPNPSPKGEWGVKAVPIYKGDDELAKKLLFFLIRAIQDGIALFGEEESLTIDYTLTNAEAAEFAKNYVVDLWDGINKTTEIAVQKAIGAFVETPGMTIGDVMEMLPFDEERAYLIARTETTRAYAEGNMMAGRELQKKYPDMRIVKRWFTKEDEKVCSLCNLSDDQRVVGLEELFVNGVDKPPAHPGCRCWMTTRTEL